ncbi:uncharacterized protein LOC121421287 [Lytechinus variegatus]|uniref:uncharacterized protein LOC121421287 n=1 Tax=Lytechinus variegatus TaxID=7654 RepID=UPI001BB24287|nr:uncharacterized protein LOC121421287 [Lytechinus variegatus]
MIKLCMHQKSLKLDRLAKQSPLLQDEPTLDDNSTESRTVINLSSYELRKEEKETLQLGLSYCPPQQLDAIQLCKDTSDFNRRIKLREYFSANDNGSGETSRKEPPPPCQPSLTKPKWTPPEGRNVYIDRFTANIENQLDHFLHNARQPETSVTEKMQRKSITSLKNNRDIIIKPADKGGAVVVQDITSYKEEVTRQLSDNTFYETLSKDPTDEFRELAQKCVDEIPGSGISLTKEPIVSQFYLLPKVHKLSKMVTKETNQEYTNAESIIAAAKEHSIIPPGRPIVSSIGSLTEPMSQFVDRKLQPYLPKIKSYIKDTTDFLKKIQSVQIAPGSTLVTMDVQSLYTNIPHREGVQAIRKFLNRHAIVDETLDVDALAHMVEFILTHNHFEYDNNHYLQKQGTAMGTKMAPAYASIFMAVIEEQFLTNHPHKPTLYARYIDDIFMIWEHPDDTLAKFHNDFNSCSESIKFTMENSKKEINFLDVSVSIDHETNTLNTSVYRKPTDSFSYLRFDSFHPKHIKQSIVYSQMLRFRRIISKEDEFDRQALILGRQFIRRGYPPKLISETIRRVKKKSRKDLLNKDRLVNEKKRLPLVTTFHPDTKKFVKQVRQEWPTLALDPKLGKIVGENPLHAQRQPPNLRKLLVSTRLPTPEHPRGNIPCDKPRCQICKHIVTDTTIRIAKNVTLHPQRHDCDASNVLYCLLCARCPQAIYIGETSTKFRMRFNNHKSSIQKKRTDLPVARHFCLPGHSLADVKVCIFGGGYKSADERRTAELRIIVKCRSFEGDGMNRDLGFLSGYSFFR